MDRVESLLRRLVLYHGAQPEDEAIREYTKVLRKELSNNNYVTTISDESTW